MRRIYYLIALALFQSSSFLVATVHSQDIEVVEDIDDSPSYDNATAPSEDDGGESVSRDIDAPLSEEDGGEESVSEDTTDGAPAEEDAGESVSQDTDADPSEGEEAGESVSQDIDAAPSEGEEEAGESVSQDTDAAPSEEDGGESESQDIDATPSEGEEAGDSVSQDTDAAPSVEDGGESESQDVDATPAEGEEADESVSQDLDAAPSEDDGGESESTDIDTAPSAEDGGESESQDIVAAPSEEDAGETESQDTDVTTAEKDGESISEDNTVDELDEVTPEADSEDSHESEDEMDLDIDVAISRESDRTEREREDSISSDEAEEESVSEDLDASIYQNKWYDRDGYESFSVDTQQLLGGPGTKFSQDEYNGDDSTVLVAKITPTIVAGSNIKCELHCTDDYLRGVIINMKYGSPPYDISDDGTRALSRGCPITLTLNTFHDADLYVTVAQDGGQILDGQVTCYNFNHPSPMPTPKPTSQPSPSTPGGICFSEDSTVQVQGKGTVEMKNLQVNDKVWVGNNGNSTQYETVYAFGHYEPLKQTDYLKIHTTSKSSGPLEISAAHLLYVEGKEEPVRADTVQRGDILTRSVMDGTTTRARVTKVEPIVGLGAYMPLTKSGFIVVNDYKASAYVSILDDAPSVVTKFQSFLSEQTLLHWWLAPYRLVCLGISPKLCENDYNEEGIAYWLVVGREIARIGDGWWIGFQLVGLAVFTLFMAACMALEAITERSILMFTLIGGLLALARITRGGQVQKRLKLD